MKISVEILCTTAEPSLRNIQAIKETYVSTCNSLKSQNKLNHDYEFYFYYSCEDYLTEIPNTYIIKDSVYPNCFDIQVPEKESVYKTFEKGIFALKQTANRNFDWHIRCNISNYINVYVLDKVISQFDKNIVYCNAINTYINDENYYNDLYPRGDMMIFSKEIAAGIIEASEKYINCDMVLTDRLSVPHVDDCLFGLCIIDYFGKDNYYNHLQMIKYNYIPEPEPVLKREIDFSCISSRVKTVPPNIKFSGYSWKDNEYRKLDVEKMKWLDSEIQKIDYRKRKIKLNEMLSDARKTLYVQLINVSIGDIKRHKDSLKKRGL